MVAELGYDLWVITLPRSRQNQSINSHFMIWDRHWEVNSIVASVLAELNITWGTNLISWWQRLLCSRNKVCYCMLGRLTWICGFEVKLPITNSKCSSLCTEFYLLPLVVKILLNWIFIHFFLSFKYETRKKRLLAFLYLRTTSGLEEDKSWSRSYEEYDREPSDPRLLEKKCRFS